MMLPFLRETELPTCCENLNLVAETTSVRWPRSLVAVQRYFSRLWYRQKFRQLAAVAEFLRGAEYFFFVPDEIGLCHH
jgi:hypothetical protein